MNSALILATILIGIFIVISLWDVRRSHPTIATIDLDKLVSILSRPLAAQYPRGDVPRRVLADLINELRGDLNAFARRKHVYLVAKQACFSEAEDLTEEFLKEIQGVSD